MSEGVPRHTRDIDVRTAASPLWDQSIEELQRVLDDPGDPNHDVAANIVKVTFEPLQKALGEQASSLSKQLMESISPLGIDVQKLFPTPRFDFRDLRAPEERDASEVVLAPARVATTPSELRTEVQGAMQTWERMIALQAQRIEQADSHATQQSTDQVRSRRLAIWGTAGSWVAAVAAVAALIITLL